MSYQDEIKNIQDTLDDHKQSIPDEVYKQLSNMTMKAFNKKKCNNKKYYKVKYAYTYTQFATKVICSDSSQAQYELNTKIHTGELILKIDNIPEYDEDSITHKFIELIKTNNIIFSSDYNLEHFEEVSDISLIINNDIHIISYKLLNKY